MKVFSADTVRKLDHQAVELGIPSILLMEHAAMSLYQKVMELVPRPYAKVCIVCGPGNNGGDGFALARLLAQETRLSVIIACQEEPSHMSQDEALYADICKSLQLPIMPFAQIAFADMDVIVDCLFGTGLCRNIQGVYEAVIHEINESDASKVACDIPSGIHADTGMKLGCAVLADETVSFAAGKPGLYFNDGILHSGTITIADILIPEPCMEKAQGWTILADAIVKQMIPKRARNSHKGSFGKVLLIGGTTGMSGAILLAGKAALRCGAGTVSIMTDDVTRSAAAVALPEAMTLPFPDTQNVVQLQQLLSAYDTIAIGNGLGRSSQAAWLVEQVWNCDRPAIFDGDALAQLRQIAHTHHRNTPYILTPHPKELSYLLDIETQEIMKLPLESLYRSEKAFSDGVLVLKNTRTLISDGTARFLNTRGNDALATGGSGDVLCGMILGFLACATPLAAAISGVYLHACCADTLSKESATHAILPSDIIEQIGKELHRIIATHDEERVGKRQQ